MTRFYFLLTCCFFLSYTPARAQIEFWEVLTDAYPNVTLRDIYVRGETLLAVGSDIPNFQPYLLRSFDEGETWDSLGFGNGPLLRTIAFSDAQNGVIGSVNTASCFLRTTDGGVTWSKARK